jgi:hypothetical protein
MNQVANVVMSQNTAQVLGDVIKGTITLVGKWRKAADLLIADGINSGMLIKPAKGEKNPNELLHNQINSVITGTFSEHVQKILAKDTKTLNDEQKETKRYWVRQTSSLFNKVRMHLVEAEKLEADPDGKSPRVPTTKQGRAKDKINEAIKILKSIEKPDFDVVAVCKALALQVATIK